MNQVLRSDFVLILSFSTPLLMVLSRNIATPIFVGVALFLLILGVFKSGKKQLFKSAKAILNCKAAFFWIALLLLMMASIFWTPALGRALGATAHLTGNLALFMIALVGLKAVPPGNYRGRVSFCFALVAAAGLILVELTFGAPVRTFLGGTGESFRMNRAAVAIVLFLPLALIFLPRSNAGMLLGLAGTAVVGYAAFNSISESAKLAYIVLLVMLPVWLVLKRRAILVLLVCVPASLILMPLVAPYLKDLIPSFVHEQVGYGTLGVRADIWAAFASLLPQAPFLGHGMEASYMAGEVYKHTDIDNHLLGKAHPHNFAIQVWYELGAVGVLVFSVLITMYFRSLRSVPDKYLPAVLATTAAVWTVSVVSHGAWQAWWWSLVGLLALLWITVLRSSSIGRTEV